MILEARGVSAGYGRLQILHRVNIAVKAGEIVGVIGPNGAGKSTLVKCIFGYLKAFEGEVLCGERRINGLSPDEVMRHGIGYVSQAGGIFADMTVSENLRMGGYSLKSKAELNQAMERVNANFPLFAKRSSQRAGNMSGGEQRALAIARALIVNPQILILDEPSAALSPRATDETYERLVKLNEGGVSMLIVEQNVPKILEIAHKVFVLDIGRNAFDGSAAELRASDRLRRLYLGES